MAFGVCNYHDTNYGSHNETPRWKENGEDDWQSIPQSYRAHWIVFQSEPDLRKFDLLVPQRLVHPNAQGALSYFCHFITE